MKFNKITQLSIFGFILLTGCNKDEYIKIYKVYKEPIEKIEHFDSNQEFYWEIPDSWVLFEGSSMRLASFRIPYSGGYGEVSVSVLDGDGGGVEMNVNRWRGQLGLPPQSLPEINSYSNYKTNKLGKYQIFKILNKETSDMAFICSIIPTESKTLFVKLYIPKIGILETEKDFMDFCQSFNLLKD